MKYGFIGLGNMAGAIIAGMASCGKFKNDYLYGYNRSQGKTLVLKEKHGLIPCATAAEVADKADVIILDEVSMMDIVLMRHFLDAVPAGCHIILVGDVDQLPAVGPGAVLKDILRSGVIPSVCLTEVFRQDEASRIVLNAHAINQGRLPECSAAGDFRFYELPDAAATADRIVDLCARELPAEGYSPLSDIQVLSPMHRQDCGVDSLNRRLQAALNPPSPAKSEYTNSVVTFRLGDKVM